MRVHFGKFDMAMMSENGGCVQYQKTDITQARYVVNNRAVEVSGDQQLATLFSRVTESTSHKISEKLRPMRDDAKFFIVEYIGPVIEEGAEELPEGHELRFWEGFVRYSY